MEKTKILEKIGLSDHEASIYLSLLENGPSRISRIHEKTAIHRPLIYKAMPKLIEKRLISKVQKMKGFEYVAEPPNRLETMFDDLKIDFFEILPDLEDSYARNEPMPKVRFLEGKDGTKRVFDDVVRSLKREDVFYRFSSNTDGQEKKDKYLPKIYRKMRDAKQLQREVITNEQTAKMKVSKLERSVKIMPKQFGNFEHNVTEIIYGNKVAFIDYNSETAMVIESKRIADFQKQIFKTLYERI